MKMDNGGLKLRIADCGLRIPSFNEDRPAVAHPAAIGRMHNKFNPFQITTRAFQITGGKFLLGPVPDENPHEFAR